LNGFLASCFIPLYSTISLICIIKMSFKLNIFNQKNVLPNTRKTR
jgi:hypothetical protein